MGLKSLLLFLCILSALSETGYALSCNICMNMFDEYCHGTSMGCPADNACSSTYTVTYSHGSPVSKTFSMACTPKNQCNVSGSLSVNYVKIKTTTTCCHKDNCTPPTPILPNDNNKPNGVTCRTCASDSSDYCYSEDDMQCTGNEMMCLFQTTEQSAPIKKSVAVRGCATKSLCDLRTQSVEFGELRMRMKFSCSSGSVGLRSSLLLCITVTLSVLKLVQ